LEEVRRRKQGVVETFRSAGRKRREETPNLALIFGQAAFDGPRSLAVRLQTGETIRLPSDKILINAGSRPAMTRVEGLERAGALDSSSIMELSELPEHLIVLGGGYIGLEFGQMFRRFGSRVTLVHRGKHLLAREDADVADEVARLLREDGLE